MDEQTIYKLDFDTYFDAVLCLDANLPPVEIFNMFSSQKVIAADGAAIRLHKMGIEPHYIIGDLDTFDKNPLSKQMSSSKIIHEPDQDCNDFEKSLKFAVHHRLHDIIIFGFHGGDLEHTLNNWSVLKKYTAKLNLCIYDKGRYGIPVYYSFKVKVEKEEIISLLPQPKARLTTKNLKWGLANEWLELGVREGARNVALKENINLTLHEGELLIFINARLPFCPKKNLQ